MTEIKLLPHQVQPTAPDYDIWTIWGDRASGKSFAAMNAAADWVSKPVETPRGPAPARVAVFVRDSRISMDVIAGEAIKLGANIRVEKARAAIEFQNGAQWLFFAFDEAERARAMLMSHAWVEDSDHATPDELERVFRVIRMELRYGAQPHIVMTCRFLPRWSARQLCGDRNRLTIVPGNDVNTSLPAYSLRRADYEHQTHDAR